MTDHYLDRAFTYHAPDHVSIETMIKFRIAFKELAALIMENTSPNRERVQALNHLETAMFWANAAMAREHK